MGYQGKSGIQTIKWNASSTKYLDPYIHQIPIYKVTFTLSSSGLTAVFNAMDDNYQTYNEGWYDGRYFGYQVGIEFWTSDTTNNRIIIQSDGPWKWGPGYGNHTLKFIKTWNELGINNINSYINTNNKSIYFRPLCVGCDMVNNPKSLLTRFTNDPQRTDWPSTCDSYTYQIIKDHTHIAKPIPILSKTTGTTITVKTPNTSCQVGLVNSNNYVSSWKSVNSSCKYTFTGLSQGNTYKIRIRQKCSCGAYIYNDLTRNNSTNIKTWSISDNTETNQNTYKQLTFKANYTAGTRGDDNGSSEQITYNLWKLSSDNEVSSLVNTITEDNNTAVTFTGLQNSTNYLCKAYITGGIADQNNNADAVAQIRRGTGKPYSVSQYINNKTTTTKLKISIKNLQYTYGSSNTNGLKSIEIQVFEYNNNIDVTSTVLTNSTISYSDLQSNSNIDKEIELNNLVSNTKYKIVCTYLGYSKYGINNTSVIGEKSQQTLNSYFTTNKATSIISIENLVSSIKAVKFDLLSTEAKSNLPSGSYKYKMKLYYINDNDETLNQTLDQTLNIPNSMFVENVENGSGSILKGASFGVYFKNATADLDLHYDNFNSTNMQPTAGIRCNSLYRIDVIDTSNNDEVVLEKYFRTDPLFAVVDDIIQTQDSLEFHVYAIDKMGNYIQTDAINRSTVFKETEIEPIIALEDVDYQNESLDSFLYANNTQIGKLNDNQNGTYSYINTIINSPTLWTASSIDDDSKTSFTVKKIIYKYKSLVYYTMHRAKLGISDGYNTVYTTKLIATSFPYNYIYYNGSWHKLMPYIYYNGSWQPLIIYIRYAAGWRLPDGNS